MKIISNNNQTKVTPMIDHLFRKKLCVHVFKCIHGYVCEKFVDYFEIMTINTRNKNIILRVPKIHLENTKKSFYFSGSKYFNQFVPSSLAARAHQ